MSDLLRNHCLRAWNKKMRLSIMMGLIVAALGVALFLSDRPAGALKLAVVGDPKIELQDDSVEITSLENPPAESELALGTYDAVIDYSRGEPQIITFKNDAFKVQLADFFSGENG